MKSRYYRGSEQSPAEVYRRVADFVAETDDDRKMFYDYMVDGVFLPNSPTLMNAGTKLGILSACFVVPVNDSMREIFDAVKNCAVIHQEGGGTGMNFSRLRPKGARVNSTGGISSGAVSFMEVFNKATDAVTQGGTRRGANMGILDCTHPEILNFITAKHVEGRLANFNISVGVTDAFMQAVQDHKPWHLTHEHDDRVTSISDANEIFDAIVDGIWRNGEPGVLFMDTANKANTTPHLGRLTATNPCWSGDTKIWTNAGVMTFEQLVANGIASIPVMTITDDGQYVYRQMRDIRMTREQARAVKITFMSGATCVCTVDHNLFLHRRDAFGEKRQAQELKPNDWLSGIVERTTHGRTIESYAQVVRSIDVMDDEIPVYNGTVDGEHRYYVVLDGNDRLPKTALLSANCGEQFLYPYESCNLGSINLAKMHVPGTSTVDLDKLAEVTRTLTRMLDNVIDKNRYPIPELKEAALKTRKIGLGIMGFHDLLLLCNLPFESHGAVKLAVEIMTCIQRNTRAESARLAAEKGVFPAYAGSTWERDGKPMRNAMLTTIAPTGTVSILADCSDAIGPTFSWAYERKNTVGQSFIVVHPIFEQRVKELLYPRYVAEVGESAKSFDAFAPDDYAPYREVIDMAFKGSIQDSPHLPDEFKRVFKTALDIPWKEHIDMQALFQRFVDNAISKTINVRKDVTRDEIREMIFYAWRAGCKGVTIYRSGSRDVEVLALKESAKAEPAKAEPAKNPVVGPVLSSGARGNIAAEVIRCSALSQGVELFSDPSSPLGISVKPPVMTPEMSREIVGDRVRKKIRETLAKIPTMTEPVQTPDDLLAIEGEFVNALGAVVTVKNTGIIPNGRPGRLPGITYHMRSGCGELFVTVNYKNDIPFELFVFTNNGGCQANMEALCRFVSIALRCRVDVDYVIRQLRKVRCPVASRKEDLGKSDGKSCAYIIGNCLQDAVAYIAEQHRRDMVYAAYLQAEAECSSEPAQTTVKPERAPTVPDNPVEIVRTANSIPERGDFPDTSICPGCGLILEFGTGCMRGKCPGCGWNGCNA